MNHLYTYMIALIQNRGNTRINQDIYTKKKFATPSENFAPLKARLQLECILKSVRISKNRINSETDRYKRGIMNQLYTYMIAWIQNRGNTRINQDIYTMYKYRHLYVNHSPKYSHSVTLCHRQGRIISGRGQGAKLRAKHANFFLPQLLKILPPPLKASKGTNVFNPSPKNQ